LLSDWGKSGVTVLRFSIFELDTAVPELRRGGRRVHLQEMPLRALEILLERPNELVTRETLFARLWPHDHTGILDDNLNTAVRKLRLALNDSAHHPRFIETVPKRGYRFVAPVVGERTTAVTASADDPHVDQGAIEPLPPAQWQEPTWLRKSLVVAALVVAVGTGIAMFRPGADVPSDPLAVPSRGEFNTLAILPFVNASGDPNDEYFSNGLAEELMDRLSRETGFRVVSRTSAFALKGRNIDAQEIGKLLGADSLVEGSVRRDHNRLRITVRLVDSRDGYQLWSETYDRRMEDVFVVQDEIAHSVANALLGRLLRPAEADELAVTATDPVAFDHYLKGRFNWHRRTEPAMLSAVEHFENAVALAPDYAPAWVGLGDAYAVLGFYDYLAPADAFPKARNAADRALRLDPDNASALATLGYTALYYDWNLPEAEAKFLQSIALAPDNSKTHQWYANLLTAAGRFEEAEQEMRRAQQLDPLSLIASAALGWVRYHAGQNESALEQFRLTLALDPDFELAYLWSGSVFEELGEYDDALLMLKEAVTRSGGSGISTASLARLHALRGEREDAERLLAGLLESASYVPSYEISKALFALQESERANEWLQRAFEQRSHSLVFLRVDPQLAAHRSDAAFIRLAARITPAGGQ
jgi:TolB-like protein/DNA-binding winged helix-turn-helix (wHTH) protein/Tfp pilus assembly protein PilF